MLVGFSDGTYAGVHDLLLAHEGGDRTATWFNATTSTLGFLEAAVAYRQGFTNNNYAAAFIYGGVRNALYGVDRLRHETTADGVVTAVGQVATGTAVTAFSAASLMKGSLLENALKGSKIVGPLVSKFEAHGGGGLVVVGGGLQAAQGVSQMSQGKTAEGATSIATGAAGMVAGGMWLTGRLSGPAVGGAAITAEGLGNVVHGVRTKSIEKGLTGVNKVGAGTAMMVGAGLLTTPATAPGGILVLVVGGIAYGLAMAIEHRQEIAQAGEAAVSFFADSADRLSWEATPERPPGVEQAAPPKLPNRLFKDTDPIFNISKK